MHNKEQNIVGKQEGVFGRPLFLRCVEKCFEGRLYIKMDVKNGSAFLIDSSKIEWTYQY